MSGLPQELVFVVLFGAVLLFQMLRKRLRQRAAPPPAEADTTPAAASPAVRDAMEALRVMAGPPLPPRTPAARRAAPRPLVAAEGPTDRRRFSRSALLGNRRSRQDAIVVAAILRPCHAQRPHEAD